MGSWPTSARKSVPRSACLTSPTVGESALVNAPRSCPKSRLSARVSGRAAQSTTTNGFSLRVEFLWMERANSSLPVPVSPTSSTLMSLVAAWATESRQESMGRLLPMIPWRRRETGQNPEWTLVW